MSDREEYKTVENKETHVKENASLSAGEILKAAGKRNLFEGQPFHLLIRPGAKPTDDSKTDNS